MASLPIFPAAAQRLVGIARLASEGHAVEEGHKVEFFTLEVKSVLNRTVSRRGMPFVWTINPYRGCEFACKYCYARYTHEFMEMRDPTDFERKIYIKQHTAWLLRQDLRKVRRGEGIALGTATDPYQPAERRHQMTRSILEEVALHQGLSFGIVTKSNLIVRDVDVLQRIAEHNKLAIHITVTTTDVELARKLEPRAPRPDLRLEALRRLREAGLNASVICAPVLPGITDTPANLEAVVRAAAEAGATSVGANPLFLKPCSRSMFLPFIEEHFPHLLKAYQARYAEHDFVSPAYRKQISTLMNKFRAKYQIAQRMYTAVTPAAAPDAQLGLFR